MIHFDEHIFQIGWFNHQLVTYPLKMDGWNAIVSFWGRLGLFSGALAVSFREGIIFISVMFHFLYVDFFSRKVAQGVAVKMTIHG